MTTTATAHPTSQTAANPALMRALTSGKMPSQTLAAQPPSAAPGFDADDDPMAALLSTLNLMDDSLGGVLQPSTPAQQLPTDAPTNTLTDPLANSFAGLDALSAQDVVQDVAKDAKPETEALSQTDTAPPLAREFESTSSASLSRFLSKSKPGFLEASPPQAQPKPAHVDKPSGLSQFMRPQDTQAFIDVKKALAAAKVLTPLVAAVSFEPTSTSSPAARSKALTGMLTTVHRASASTAKAMEGLTNESVPNWMRTQLMASFAGVVAQRWQRAGGNDTESVINAMADVFVAARSDTEIMNTIEQASHDAYQEVTNADVARNRIAVSAANAAWMLYDWVTNERLSMDPANEPATNFYTYDYPINEVVNKMLTRCIDEASALVAEVDVPDMRVSHLQSSIGRMANLVGAEYVTQTRLIMNWIGEDGISDAEQRVRIDSAKDQLESRILPSVYEWARQNFLRIERGALGLVDQYIEKEKSVQRGSHASKE